MSSSRFQFQAPRQACVCSRWVGGNSIFMSKATVPHSLDFMALHQPALVWGQPQCRDRSCRQTSPWDSRMQRILAAPGSSPGSRLRVVVFSGGNVVSTAWWFHSSGKGCVASAHVPQAEFPWPSPSYLIDCTHPSPASGAGIVPSDGWRQAHLGPTVFPQKVVIALYSSSPLGYDDAFNPSGSMRISVMNFYMPPSLI